MKYSKCQSSRFVPFGFLMARFSQSGKTFRASLATILVCLMLVPQPLLAQTQTYSCPTAFGLVGAAPGAPVAPVLPALLMQSLKTAPNAVLPNGTAGIVRDDLLDFIANQQAAIQLGKMFFWEMQAGSDNKTACATCHFKAGQDGRDRNQMNPGANGNWDGFGYGPNYALIANDFPLTNLPTKDVDNIIGSQGVRMSQFTGFSRSGAETTTSVPDPVFSVSGVNVRQPVKTRLQRSTRFSIIATSLMDARSLNSMA